MKITIFLTLTLLPVFAKPLNFPKVFPLKAKIELLCCIADRQFWWVEKFDNSPNVTREVGDNQE